MQNLKKQDHLALLVDKKFIRFLGVVIVAVIVILLMNPTSTFASERRAVYLERNYSDSQGVMHHLTNNDYLMAEKEFNNTIDPYIDSKILDAFTPKEEVKNGLNDVFKNASENDVNYLIIDSHGNANGIIDFSFKELKAILDQCKGHFIIVVEACESGGIIDKMQKSLIQTFKAPENKSGEFKNSKYNVFCSSSKTQNSYGTSDYSFFIKAYFDSSQLGENENYNADVNHDDVVTSTELENYLSSHGHAYDATPVFQIVAPDLTVFEKPKQALDFYGCGTWSGNETHIAKLDVYSDGQAILHEGLEMYGCQAHPCFTNTYFSIKVEDKNGKELFYKDIKGTDYVAKKNETIPMQEGEHVTIHHEEGVSSRYSTSDDKSLKSYPGNEYYYTVKNGRLVEVTDQSIDMHGCGTWSSNETHIAKLDVYSDGQAILHEGLEMYGCQAHPCFTNTYFSIKVEDKNGKELFYKDIKGTDYVAKKNETIPMQEGEHVTIHHEEGASSRYNTSDDAKLKTCLGKVGSTYTYEIQNNQLILTNVK